MKTKILFILIFLSFNVFAQKINEEQLPKDVLIGLETTYPDVKAKSWEMKDGNYIANVKIDEQSGFAEFSPEGKWIVTKFPVGEKELPSSVVKFFYENYAPDYKITISQIIEEPNDNSYYYLKIQKKGLSQDQNGELFFDLKGKLTKNTAPENVKTPPATAKKDDVFEEDEKPAKSKKKKEVVEEEEEEIPAPKAEKIEKPAKGAKTSRVSSAVREKPEPKAVRPAKTSKNKVEEEEEVSSTGTPAIVTKYFNKKFPRAEDIEWTQQDSNYIASFIFHDMEQRAEFAPDGKLVGTTSIMDPKNIFKPLENYLVKKYNKFKVLKAEKTQYERTYQKLFPEKKLKNFYYVEISEKVKGSKIPKISKLWFDGVGAIDRIEEGDVEDEAPVKEKRGKHDKSFEDNVED